MGAAKIKHKKAIPEDAIDMTSGDIDVCKDHHVILAQRTALAVAGRSGLRQKDAFAVATCVSELAQNLVSYAHGGGRISISPIVQNDNVGIEITVIDDGPGIADISLAMAPGHSSRGGIGEGLNSVARMMDEFEIHSSTGAGTRIVTRLWRS